MMETLNIKRRKKRRTRRCLDEIRKKTHQTVVSKINKNTNTAGHKSKSCCLKNSNFITSNRLTLNKMVRSETVTRLQHSNSESKKPLKFDTDHKEKENIKYFTKNILPFKLQNDKSVLDNRIITKDTNEPEYLSPKLNIHKIGDETPRSIMLFSPENQDDKGDPKLNRSLDVSSVLSSSSSSISSANLEQGYYDEFMDNIESYIERTFPQCMKCDFVEKCKTSLINAYMQNFYNNTKEYTSNNHKEVILSNKHESPPAIIQNPRDYLGYVWKQCPKSTERLISSPTDTSSSSDSLYKPSTSQVISPTYYKSPELTYYPHRLN